jgi:hypothetical protein
MVWLLLLFLPMLPRMEADFKTAHYQIFAGLGAEDPKGKVTVTPVKFLWHDFQSEGVDCNGWTAP